MQTTNDKKQDIEILDNEPTIKEIRNNNETIDALIEEQYKKINERIVELKQRTTILEKMNERLMHRIAIW